MTQLLQCNSKRVNSSPRDNPWRFLDGLFAAAFVPAIPVVIGPVPFDVLARGALKMLF
jgi:hypothetical protein